MCIIYIHAWAKYSDLTGLVNYCSLPRYTGVSINGGTPIAGLFICWKIHQ